MKFFLLIFFFISSSFSFSQSSNDLANTYLKEAFIAYNEGNFLKTLEYCDIIENLRGDASADLQLLRVKSYFESGRLLESLLAIDKYYTFPTTQEIEQQINPYIIKVQEAAAEERKKQAEKKDNEYIRDNNSVKETDNNVFWIMSNKKYALFDSSNRQLTPYKYDKVTKVSENYYEVCLELLSDGNVDYFCGFTNNQGFETVPLLYSEATFINENLILVVQNNTKKKLIDIYNNTIVEDFPYDELIPMQNDSKLIIIKQNNKYGFMNERGLIIAPLQYDDIRTTPYNLAIVKLENKYGAVNLSGIPVLPNVFEHLSDIDIHPNIIKVRQNNKYGAYNYRGIELLEAKYDEISLINKFLITKNENKQGLYDLTSGRELLEIDFELIDFKYFEKYGIILIKKNNKFGVVDKNGEIKIPVKYDQLEIFHNSDYLKILENNSYGMLDLNLLKEVIPARYDIVYYNNDLEAYQIIKSGKFGLFNSQTSQITIPAIYENILQDEVDYSENKKSQNTNRFRVVLDGKTGIIDANGKEIVKPKYDEIKNWSNKMAAVSLNNNWTFINESGNEITPFKYQSVGEFKDFFAKVKVKDKWGFIDNKGQEITDLKYDEVRDFSNNYAAIRKGKKWGFINTLGNEIVKPRYDIVEDMVFNRAQKIWTAKLKKGKKRQVITLNEKGEKIK